MKGRPSILQTRNLTLQRPNGLRLSFPDIELVEGGRLLLLGASGTGKTTLLSILAGLLTPSAGTVALDGEDLYALSGPARDRLRGGKIGFVFQTLHLLPSLTAVGNVLLAARMAGRDADVTRAMALMGSLGLAGKEGRYPSTLSQGEQQRVALARAMFNHPQLLIADEPTSALDDRNTKITMDLLEEQAAVHNAALLVATHDGRIADRFDRCVTLEAPESGSAA